MATQYQTGSEAITALPHEVALPYRGDGVACALRATYVPDDDCIPNDMLALLIAIDVQALITDLDLVS